MYLHLIGSEQKFLCGLSPDGVRSYVPVKLYQAGDLRPAGSTKWCPFCLGAMKHA